MSWFRSKNRVGLLAKRAWPFYIELPRTSVVGPDDTVYVPFASFHLQQYGDCTSVSANDEVALGLLTIRPDGSSSSSKLVTFPWVFGQTQFGVPLPPQTTLAPRNVIPTNTPGEVLVNWIEIDDSIGQYGGPHFQTKITRVTSTGVNTYSTPSANQTQMVIGENNLGYGMGELGVSAFDIATGVSAWTTSDAGDLAVATATGVATTSNGGVTIYDQAGTPTSYNLGIQHPVFRSTGTWSGVSTSLAPIAGRTATLLVALSASPYYPALSRGNNNAARLPTFPHSRWSSPDALHFASGFVGRYNSLTPLQAKTTLNPFLLDKAQYKLPEGNW